MQITDIQKKRLSELFDEWKEEHEKDNDASTYPKKDKNTMPAFADFKKFFYPDGFLDESEFNGILVICRESNAQEDIEKGEMKETDYFWLKEEIYKTKKHKYVKQCENYFKYVMMCIGENADFKKCAYMNLNKRGGYSNCSQTQLKKYVAKYKDLIYKEIEIIDPKIIICGGTYGLVSSVLKDKSLKNLEAIYDCFHPSYAKFKCENVFNV